MEIEESIEENEVIIEEVSSKEVSFKSLIWDENCNP